MKIRNGFVSNSSSSSFIIKKENLSEKQMESIFNHTYVTKCEKLLMFEEEDCAVCDFRLKCALKTQNEDDETKYGWLDEWNITDNEDNITGSTSMNNFDMDSFLTDIGVKEDAVKWSS